ncbi:HipA N-terminal domain-containing protein [Pseudarthrobacter sp. H2]|uniref:HipA N-terminal domain-containing protein n=1 Tax=Pseudarthrobacter sp. H2 TaxID=3418415 RepID=UPI003CEFB5DA
MAADLQRLRFLPAADVYRQGRLAAHLSRTETGGTSFAYDPGYLAAGLPGVATTLPAGDNVVETPGSGLPAFFAGLLPEGHRLTVLKDAAKTSLNDELTLLMAVGADVPGDVQIVPAGETPAEPDPLADTSGLSAIVG